MVAVFQVGRFGAAAKSGGAVRQSVRMKLLVALVATGFVATASVADAVHEDVIPQPIADSDVDIALETVADGFTTPLWAINAPGDNSRVFVVDQVGKIWAIKIQPGNGIVPERLLLLDVGVDGLDLLVPLGAFGPGTFDERGLLGLAFHPDYRNNGLLYTYSSEPPAGPADFTTQPGGLAANHQSVVREWQVPRPKRPDSSVDPASSRVLLTIDEPQFNHNAGALNFGRDHLLYIAVGDGGSADDQGVGHAPGGNGQDLSPGNVLGKILRIDPLGSDSANGQYGIPSDNPFVGAPGADEIYAYGFRNPFRTSFDADTGELIAADVGQNDIEEVDVVVAGGNYGWPVKEGTFLFDMNGADPGFTTVHSPGVPAGLIDPIAEYDHDEGVSVTGGFVYRGKAVKDLRGSYVFGDFARTFAGPSGRLFHLAADGEIVELDPVGQSGLGLFLTGFGQDRKGELYVMGQLGFTPVGTTGVLQRIVTAD
jgi:glucose/arabinose dehydrogenase